MLSHAERSNFLRQCWRTRHWKDGVGTLLLPLRLSLYKLRRKVARSTAKRQGKNAAPVTAGEGEPSFSQEIYPLFAKVVEDVAEIDRSRLLLGPLFAEVDAQLAGTWRLAGGRRVTFNAATIGSREDVEDVHAYHRLYWALRYAEAAAFDHTKAADALLSGLTQWLNSTNPESPIASWPYTIAERIASLSAILFWIQQSRSKELFTLIVPVKRQIWKDALRLSSTVEFGLGVHNHLLNDARGLFLASAALGNECDESASWRDQGLKLWDEYFPQLLLEDGTFAEQSSHYHLLLSRTALDYWLSCRNGNHTLPSGFESRIRLMFELANELLREDGSLPRFGDNSPDRIISDLWGLFDAARFYGLLQTAPRHSRITPLTIFYCGVCPDIPQPNEAAVCRLFPEGGFAFLRSPSLNAELVAHSDARDTVGAHGDAGRGSYELWWNGRILVREPGSFSSLSDNNWQRYQSASSQNVTSLDGLPPVIIKPDQRYATPWYVPKGGVWEALPDGGVRFQCTAFRRLREDITLFRSWWFEQPETLRFEERIEGSKRVEFESCICLGDLDWGPLEKSESPDVTELRWKGQDGSAAQMIIQAPSGIAITSRDSTFLPEYGVEKQGRSLVLNGSQQLPFSWTAEWRLRKSA